MAWGRITDRTRKQFRLGPYFRNYALKVSRDGAEGGFKSHGIKVGSRRSRLGSFTVNLTNRTWTWDRPGPGATHGSWGKPKTREGRAARDWTPAEERQIEKRVSRAPRERNDGGDERER
jgi:hypothetical protein